MYQPNILKSVQLTAIRDGEIRSVERSWLPAFRDCLALTGLGLAVAMDLLLLPRLMAFRWVGTDLQIMQTVGDRWLATGSMYLAAQLSGPYAATFTDIAVAPGLYPPAAGPLFGLLALMPFWLVVVPWFAVPIGYLTLSIRAWSPARWALLAIVALLLLPPVIPIVISGGTTLWVAAAFAAALRGHRSLGALALLKPSLAPFALIGWRSWQWWATVAVMLALTLLGPWRDYIAVVSNVRGVGYLLWSLPLLLIPLVAWSARAPRPRD